MRFGPYRGLLILAPIVLMVTSVGHGRRMAAQPKTPIPDAQAQQTAKKAAGELFADRFTQATTTAEKTALATDMMDAAGKVQAGSADQYVLLKIALDVAARDRRRGKRRCTRSNGCSNSSTSRLPN